MALPVGKTKRLANGDLLEAAANTLKHESDPFLRAAKLFDSGKAPHLGGGDQVQVFDAGDFVIKTGKDLEKRALIEAHLAEKGLAPPTRLVRTPKGDILVQAKVDTQLIPSSMPDFQADRTRRKMIDDLASAMGKAGVGDSDLALRNMGLYEGKPVNIDAGKAYRKTPFTEEEVSGLKSRNFLEALMDALDDTSKKR